MLGGRIQTQISADGLTGTNTTLLPHLLYDGQAERSVFQIDDGTWYAVTRGYGNNVIPGMNWANEWAGPGIFNSMDRQMRLNIQRHRFGY
jgi:hypothetical protein